MAVGTTTYTSISQRTQVWAAVEMLSHAEPVLVLSKFAMTKPMPRNKADTVKFRRPKVFGPVTTALTEGVPPTVFEQVQYDDVPFTLTQYGNAVKITDKIQDMAEDPVLKDAAMLLGEQAGLTIETLLWNDIRQAAANIVNAGGASGLGSINSVFGVNDIRKAIRLLKTAKARPFTQILSGSPDYATQPIEASYIAVGHTNLEADIRNLPNFTPVAKYGTMKPVAPQEIGAFENIRFVLSPELDSLGYVGATTPPSTVLNNGSNVEVYPLVILARESIGLVPLKGRDAIKPIIVPVDQPDKSDPLGQFGTVGWKTWYAGGALNTAWMAVINTAVSAL